MSDILQRILATKRDEVAAAKSAVPLPELRARTADAPPPRDFVGAIRAKHAAGRPAVIAEIKRQSPSAGQFRVEGDFDPARFAASYERAGAACLSVLTDRDYFGGTLADMRAARAGCRLPVLRKDFLVDEYQLYEARAHGADAVLFIIDAVPIERFIEWELIAEELGLAVLVESHTRAQLADALTLKSALMGINNRDLTRFVTDLNTTLTLRVDVPASRILITESGVESQAAIDLLRENGVETFLIGGALMKAADPGDALQALFVTQR